MKVTLSLLAKRDLRSILVNLADENVQASLALDARFTSRLEQVGRFPEIGRPRLDIGTGVRGLLVSPYLIFYVIGSSRISILRVLHTSRDLGEAIRR